MRLLVIIIALVGSSTSLARPWFSEKGKARFSWRKNPQASGETLWQNGGWSLDLKPVKNIQDGLALLDGNFHVLVHFKLGSPLAEKLNRDKRTLFYNDEASESHGFAIIEAASAAEFDDYAHEAHSHEDGLACGRVQILPDQPAMANLIISPPVLPANQKNANVEAAVGKFDFSRFASHVESLAQLGTRHHSSSNADAASQKVYEMFQTAGAGIAGFRVEYFTHQRTKQKSVIATIDGTDDNASTVIMGAHLDSMTLTGSASAPGADDDASGIATLAEIIRAIAEQGLRFDRKIEFHGYAAEEGGLIGSGEIAGSYKSSGRSVASMMQFDMVAYGATDTIYLISNNTNAELRQGTKDLLNTYLGGNFQEAQLTAGSSDHASWTSNGFPAVFPFENPNGYNQSIHTSGDTPAQASNHALALRFGKLGIAYLGHYAGLAADDVVVGDDTPPTTGNGGDLKLAIVKKDDGGYVVAVSAAIKHEVIKLCQINAATDTNCTGPVTEAPYYGAKDDRYLYFTGRKTLPLSAGQNWRIRAYDSKDQERDVRNVTLGAK